MVLRRGSAAFPPRGGTHRVAMPAVGMPGLGLKVTLALALLAGAACGEDTLARVYGALEVCADAAGDDCASRFALGALRSGEGHGRDLWVHNRGLGVLTLAAVDVAGGDAAGIVFEEVPERIDARAAAPLRMVITPDPGPQERSLTFRSDDPERPSERVEVSFEGVAPVLVVCPGPGMSAEPDGCGGVTTIDLGEVRPTQSADAVVLVRNAGTSTLDIAGVEVTDGASAPHLGELTIVTSTAPGQLEPGTETQMVVRYRPADGFEDRIDIEVIPADDLTPRARVTVTARTPANEPPVALAMEASTGSTTATGVSGLALWLDGRGSYDAEGDPLRFRWSVAAASVLGAGSLDAPEAQVTRFVSDLPGTFTVQLQVSDALGLVGYADVDLVIEPRRQVVVLLSWGTAAGDVDLHLVPDGDPLFGATDCFFEQPTVDWGVGGVAADDPVLLSDTESGDGAERVVIPRPAAGDYAVVAHYFDDRGGRPATITATVLADDETRVLGTATATLDQTCQAWIAGVLHWPAGTFSPGTAPVETRCYGP